jgi:hypothetical protein
MLGTFVLLDHTDGLQAVVMVALDYLWLLVLVWVQVWDYCLVVRCCSDL